jgi:hypothetical protein
MAAVLLAVQPSLWAGVPLGIAVYAAALAAWERAANPADLRLVLAALRRRDPVPAP